MKLFKYKPSKELLKRFVSLFFLLLPCFTALGYTGTSVPVAPGDSLYVFRFVPGNDMFYIPWQGNDVQLSALCDMINTHREAIEAGTLPVHVDSYCASLPAAKENLVTAFTRANRVKSELIIRAGLKESHFVTANYARSYRGKRDIVVVTLRVPAREKPRKPEIVKEHPDREHPKVVEQPRQQPVVDTPPAPVPEPVVEPVSEVPLPYRFAVRTNLLYDAFLLPTLGVEWRMNDRLGVRIDGSLSRWGDNGDKVQKIWLVNPELRWYMLRDRRFYVGISGNYGEYNIYKYMLGNLLKDDTGYQGSLWSAGLTVGYQLYLTRCFSVDFNLGLGYTRSGYDSFTVIDNVRVYMDRDKTKSLWGPTQAGISLVWTMECKK